MRAKKGSRSQWIGAFALLCLMGGCKDRQEAQVSAKPLPEKKRAGTPPAAKKAVSSQKASAEIKMSAWPSENHPSALAASSMAAGASHTCMLRNAEVFCWGSNRFGQIGQQKMGYREFKNKPVKVDVEGQASKVYAGYWNSCALNSQKDLYCWGHNGYGQLLVTSKDEPRKGWPTSKSEGSEEPQTLFRRKNRNTPTKIASWVRDVAVGKDRICFLDMDGAVTCLGGANPEGDLTGHRAIDIAVGDELTCLIDKDRVLTCHGLLPTGFLSPKREISTNADEILCEGRRCCFATYEFATEAGSHHGRRVAEASPKSALRGKPTLKRIACFGRGHKDQFPDPIRLIRPVEQHISEDGQFFLGKAPTCRRIDGNVKCAGLIAKSIRLSKVDLSSLSSDVEIACGFNHCCFDDGKSVHCLGAGGTGENCGQDGKREDTLQRCVLEK